MALQACAIAVHEIPHFLARNDTLEKVIFVAFDAEIEELYRRALGLL
jgi:hypothetical protein